MPLPGGTTPTTMKNRILRLAAALGLPVTIRKVPGGLLFWRSTAEDTQQAQEVAGRLQTARRSGARSPNARPSAPHAQAITDRLTLLTSGADGAYIKIRRCEDPRCRAGIFMEQ